MDEKILKGKKIAVLLETEYIAQEIEYYRQHFTALGAQVDLMSYLWGEKSKRFICDIDSPDRPIKDIHTIEVDIDVTNVKVDDYHAVLMAANYCSVRLREIPPMHSLGSCELTRTAPAVQFFGQAMKNKKIVKGALCHALWILTPLPELLKDRKVICHTVVLADICNAGALFTPSPEEVVVDDDLITARSAKNLIPYCDAIVKGIVEKNQ
jgi:protease I